MVGRPRRQAAVRATQIIELSDSDEDAPTVSRTRRRDSSFSPPPTKLARIDAAARSVSGGEVATGSAAISRKRFPTTKKTGNTKEAAKVSENRTKKDGKSASRSKKSKEKPSVTIEVDCDVIEVAEDGDAEQQQLDLTIGDPEVAAPVDTTDGQCNSRAESQTSKPSRESNTYTGRSSFWARRKVWRVDELLAEKENVEPSTARNIVQLLENENTIPFICRYRRDLINHITPERLRDIKNSYTEIVELRKRAETIVTQLEKEQQIGEEVRTEILCAKSNEELEFLYAPYKPASKGSLAERAKALGLGDAADRLLFGEAPEVRLETLVDHNNPDLESVEKVLQGICHIISHNISKHTGVLEEMRRLQKVHRIVLKCSKAKDPSTAAVKKAAITVKNKLNNNNNTIHSKNKADASKYETYYDFQQDVRYLKPHQVLAINRAEKQKFLTVKIITADYVKNDIKRFTRELFMNEGLRYPLRNQVFEQAFEECYSKKLQPLLSRQIRSDLNELAKKAAIDVFAQNLKQLLLQSPLKGERILGIDPGFTNGCKLALISETADVLETGVIYPHARSSDPEEVGHQLAKMLIRHNCKIIALGNGTACRETEFWLSNLFDYGILDKNTVRYSIVSEQGASIYSCGEVARKEFPDMDMNEISAVSISRRLNDPLSEYVKIEPRHIGVGMYQHDVPEKTLNEALNEVVSECVSFVGVDINTASLSVLKHVAGLSEKKAQKIIEHRSINGPFQTRKDLLKVKSIGEKTFVQCAGFIRIEPLTVGGKIENLLDCTWVHPESYAVAKKIISKCNLLLNDIGTKAFICKIKAYALQCDMEELAEDFNIPKERLDVVLMALQRELTQDYRAEFAKRPLFKQGLTRITELSEGDVLTGAISNITHFGAFLDVGVECNALLHISKMRNTELTVGDRVTVSIIQIDIPRKRIGVQLEDMIKETDTSFTLT
ncbi:PREDICTED: S1 RNA-binding domain-containing protein 1 isoform X2 [Rhagoletis zephyria]|uniref:S1 RNA-binding domain-containing protein 1 isoform X2 n=1 Tax=Rhagoletis zephyria TaxID=28612 RepID=UPI0008114FFF|nr:PREDICTED: S1 RNA-binding domain-containing protein 1 isoform X2 [Rhagoletis zephyria]